MNKQELLHCLNELPLESLQEAIAQAKEDQLTKDAVQTLWDACSTAIDVFIKTRTVVNNILEEDI